MKNIISALNMAISMFTIIPLPKYVWEEKAGKYIMPLYPLVGAIVGVIWFLVFKILNGIGCANAIMAAILMSTPFIITGFMHLDGFMDVSDALLSRRPKEVKLKILKDSTVGAFSVIALGLLFILEFAAIQVFLEIEVNPMVLIIIPILSRSISAMSILSKEPIEESYYVKLYKEGSNSYYLISIICIYIITSIIAYTIGSVYLIMSLVMILFGYILVRNCEKELGGVNGDVAGYTVVLTELIGILTIAIL